MNLGFYVDSLGESQENDKIYDLLDDCVAKNKVHDASLFYNDISFNRRTNSKFGIFNSTDIWAFTGTLICEGMGNIKRALSVVNKFKPIYLFKEEKINLVSFMDITSEVEVITRTDQDADTVYRLTGKRPHLFKDWSLDNIIEVLECQT